MTKTTISYNPNWQTDYEEMVVSAHDAVSHIQPGQSVFLGTGCATPVALVKALVGRSRELTDIEIIQLLTRGDAPYATKELANCFPVNSFFISQNVRDIIHTPPAEWDLDRRREYLDWAEKVVDNCRNVNGALKRHFDALLKEGRCKL